MNICIVGEGPVCLVISLLFIHFKKKYDTNNFTSNFTSNDNDYYSVSSDSDSINCEEYLDTSDCDSN